jgi:hypothetical protein
VDVVDRSNGARVNILLSLPDGRPYKLVSAAEYFAALGPDRRYVVRLRDGSVQPIGQDDDWPAGSVEWSWEGNPFWYGLEKWP